MSITDKPLALPSPTVLAGAALLAERPDGRHNAAAQSPPPEIHRSDPPSSPQQHETVVALLDAMKKGRSRLEHHGDLLMQRTVDWARSPRIPPPSSAEDSDTATSGQIEDRQGDAAASRYQREVRAIAVRIRTDLARLIQIDAMVVREQPKRLEGKDMLATQVAAAGYCVSCWRFHQHITERQKDRDDDFRDKEACDRCAGFRREHGMYPPMMLLEAWHGRGKNWTPTLVRAALDNPKR